MALANLDGGVLGGAAVEDAIDPALLVIGGTFLLGVAMAVTVAWARWIMRRSNRRASEPCGLVDVSFHRPVDVIGVSWIVGIYLWLSLAQIAALKAMEGVHAIGVADLWVSIVFQVVMAGMVILVMSPRVHVPVWLGLGWRRWRELWILAPLSVAFMWLLFGILQAVGYTSWLESLDFETMQESVRALQKKEDLGFLILMRFSAIVVAPVCEEVVFRGYLYGVAKRYCGPVAAALSSALIFSAAHASVAALLPLALFGLLLAWLYERTGSLWAPIAAHACFNAATVMVLMIQ